MADLVREMESEGLASEEAVERDEKRRRGRRSLGFRRIAAAIGSGERVYGRQVIEGGSSPGTDILFVRWHTKEKRIGSRVGNL